MAPVWRRNPPCDAHLKLDKMFEDKLISPADDPKKVRLKDPIFAQFSLPVFKGVWRELYAKHGVGLQETSSSSTEISTGHSSKRNRISDEVDENVEPEKKESPVSYTNDPVIMTVYQDPVTEKDILFIAVILPGGVDYSAVTFSLCTSGHGSSNAKITYPWPKIIFDWKSMFDTELESKELLNFHPLVAAVRKEMKNHRESVDSTPQCVINLSLPIPVQTAAETIKKGQEEAGW